METEQLINVRLQMIATVEPKSAVEDVLFYKYIDEEGLNIALLPIEGMRNSIDKEEVRKLLLRQILSKSFLKSRLERSEFISEIALFSIDSLSQIDHCFVLNIHTLKYEYCSYDFNGNILLTKYYDLDYTLESITEADFKLSQNEEYYPSEFIENLFKNEINKPVLDDSRSIPYEILYGMSLRDIRAKVLEFGLSNFDSPYLTITPDEKVNLYCYLNLKKHYFTTYAIIERMFASVGPIDKIHSVNFLDYGCGPLTSGIAIADLYSAKTSKKIKINYIGIDISNAMLKKAKQFSQFDCFSDLSRFKFSRELGGDVLAEFISSSSDVKSINIINFSYLFASNTLDIKELRYKLKAIENIKGPSFLLYQNSANESKNENWEMFKTYFDLILIFSGERKVKYYTRRSYNCDAKEENVKFEILKFIQKQYTI